MSKRKRHVTLKSLMEVSLKRTLPKSTLRVIFIVFLSALFTFPTYAQQSSDGSATDTPPLEEFSPDPNPDFSKIQQEEAEASDMRFFEYGRFFGISVGVGYQGVTGNRGLLWRGGFPLGEFKLHYFFDFHTAITLGYSYVTHSYATTASGSTTSTSRAQVNLGRVGVDFKYYFSVRDASAPITFMNPFLTLGVGSYSKKEVDVVAEIDNTDNVMGFGAGGGLEFLLSSRQIYLVVEGKINFVPFKDMNSTLYASSGVADLTGLFYNTTASFLICW